MVNRCHVIYGLIDPRDGQLRYVGKTCSSAAKRLSEHLGHARRGRQRHVYNWLRQLLAASLKPEVEVLETCESAKVLSEVEQFYIAYFRMVGCRLTNLTDGGEGTVGWIPTKETKEKIGRSHIGKVLSAETRALMSAQRKGRPHSAAHNAAVSASKVGVPKSDEMKLKMRLVSSRKPVIDDTGRVFLSIHDAARQLGVSKCSIQRALIFGRLVAGTHLSLLKDSPRAHELAEAAKRRPGP